MTLTAVLWALTLTCFSDTWSKRYCNVTYGKKVQYLAFYVRKTDRRWYSKLYGRLRYTSIDASQNCLKLFRERANLE